MAATDGGQTAQKRAGGSEAASTAPVTLIIHTSHCNHFLRLVLPSLLTLLARTTLPALILGLPYCLFDGGVVLGREVEFEAVSVVAAEVVVAHLAGLEEAEAGVEAEGGGVDALRFQHDLVHFSLHSPHELGEQLHPDAQAAVGGQHHQHGDVGFAGVDCVDVADDAADYLLPQVGHHRQLRPVLHEVVVGEDRVGLGQRLPQGLSDPVQFGGGGEGDQADGRGGVHYDYQLSP